jgi:hypothetical protein
MNGNVVVCVGAVGCGKANRKGVADCEVYREKFLSHNKTDQLIKRRMSLNGL